MSSCSGGECIWVFLNFRSHPIWLWTLQYIAGAGKIISRSTLKVVWGQRDTRRDGAPGVTLQKRQNPLLSLPLSPCCPWPCVPLRLGFCGVNTLLSNALLADTGVKSLTVWRLGGFIRLDGKIIQIFSVADLDSLFTSISQLRWVYLSLLSSREKFPSRSHSPVLSRSQVSQKLFIQPRRGSNILIATPCHRRLTFQIAILFYPLPILSLIIFSSLFLPHSQWTSPSPPPPLLYLYLLVSIHLFLLLLLGTNAFAAPSPLLSPSPLTLFLSLQLYLSLSNCHFCTAPTLPPCVCACVCVRARVFFLSIFSMFKHPFASHY